MLVSMIATSEEIIKVNTMHTPKDFLSTKIKQHNDGF